MAGSNNKKNKLRGVTEIVNLNHKRKINESTSWVDLGSGNRPTNSTAQTFGLFYTGTDIPVPDANFNNVTAVFGGLGGVESLPASFTYADAEGVEVSVDPPTYNQLAVAGFAKPLGKYDNFIRKSAAKKASQINDQLDASEKVAARANADVLMKARVEEAEKIYNDLYKQYEAEKKAVDEYNKNVDNAYEKEKEKVRVNNEKIMMQHHKTISGVKWDSVRQMGVPDIDNVPAGSDLDIQNKLNAKYFKNGVMTITPEKYAQLFDEMGGKANEETRERLEKKIKPDPERPPYKEYPSYPDYPDVNDDKYWNDGLTAATGEIGVTADDEKFLKKQQTLVNLTKWMNKIGLPNDFAQWTLNYANNDMTPITKFSPGMEQQVLNLVNDKFSKNPNATVVDIQYKDYGFKFKALPTRLGLGRFTATKLDNGDIRIEDTFNVDKVATHLGAAQIVPGLQDTADRLVDISYKKRNISGVFDEGGIPIDVIIKSKKKKKDEKLKEGKTFKNFMSSINN